MRCAFAIRGLICGGSIMLPQSHRTHGPDLKRHAINHLRERITVICGRVQIDDAAQNRDNGTDTEMHTRASGRWAFVALSWGTVAHISYLCKLLATAGVHFL